MSMKNGQKISDEIKRKRQEDKVNNATKEEKFLIDNYANMVDSEMIEAIGVDKKFIKNCVSRFGLKKSKETYARGRGLGAKGKTWTLSEETRKKQSDAQRGKVMSIDARSKMSKAKRGKPGRKWTDDQKEKQSVSRFGDSNPFFGKEHSVETKEELSKIGAMNARSNPYANGTRESGHYDSIKTKRKCFYKSSWERKFMVKLDNDQKVSFWRYEPFMVSYFYEYNRKYVPDFIVEYKDGSRELVEIHPAALIGGKEKAKYAAAQDWCIDNSANWRLITEL